MDVLCVKLSLLLENNQEGLWYPDLDKSFQGMNLARNVVFLSSSKDNAEKIAKEIGGDAIGADLTCAVYITWLLST